MAYLPTLKQVTLDTGVIAGVRLRARWYDPREGVATVLGEFQNTGAFVARRQTHGPDWVLVVDDAAQGYGSPGERR